MIKTLLWITCSLVLFACHAHNNPLLSAPPTKSAHWIYQAQLYAMQRTHFYDASGEIYLNCVQRPDHYSQPFTRVSGPKRCAILFASMAHFAQRSKVFHQITVSNLKDQRVAERLQQRLLVLARTQGQRDQE